MENQFSRKINLFQSSGGGEFRSIEFFEHLEKCGIERQVFCPGTLSKMDLPNIDTSWKLELTMMFHAKLPKFSWVEVSLTVVYLIKRQPSQAIQMDNPFFKLFPRNPNYCILKVLGCRSFPYWRDLASEAIYCVFMGYDSIHKGFDATPHHSGKFFCLKACGL